MHRHLRLQRHSNWQLSVTRYSLKYCNFDIAVTLQYWSTRHFGTVRPLPPLPSPAVPLSWLQWPVNVDWLPSLGVLVCGVAPSFTGRSCDLWLFGGTRYLAAELQGDGQTAVLLLIGLFLFDHSFYYTFKMDHVCSTKRRESAANIENETLNSREHWKRKRTVTQRERRL